MASPIEKNLEKFTQVLENYVKHKTLEIEVTLKNGRRIIIDENREMKNGEIIQHMPNGKDLAIAIKDIKKADIFAI